MPLKKPDGDPERKFIASMVKLHRVTPERVSPFWVCVHKILAVHAIPTGQADSMVFIEGIAEEVLIFESAEQVCYLIEEHETLRTAEMVRRMANLNASQQGSKP